MIEDGCHNCRSREIIPVGTFAGFDLQAVVHPRMDTSIILSGARRYEQELKLFQTPVNLILGLEAIPRRLESIVPSLEHTVGYLRAQVAIDPGADEPFPKEAKLEELLNRLREIDGTLRAGDDRPTLGDLDITPAVPDEAEAEMAAAA